MSDLNHVVITGRLVRSPSMSGKGPKSALFRIAANRTKTDAKQRETAYLNCRAFGNWAEALVGSTSGDMVLVEGRLRTEEWPSDDGAVRLELALVVSSVRFMNRSVPLGTPAAESNGAFVDAGAAPEETNLSEEGPF